ncbi:MAG TPA: hypothetical protein ENI69_00960 [Rhodospirillales bacterium]|nr:hypothetical protein [Rhodospirillales bacterium]
MRHVVFYFLEQIKKYRDLARNRPAKVLQSRPLKPAGASKDSANGTVIEEELDVFAVTRPEATRLLFGGR